MTQTLSVADFALRLGVGVGCGALVGMERQWRARRAGLRTNALVAAGATLFVLYAVATEDSSPTRVASYVVSGIGFLGAGVILKDGGSIRGLNTAATLWCSAAVGTFSGAGLPLEAIAVTAFVLAGNTLLRPLVNWVNRRPFDEATTEAHYAVHATCDRANVADVRDLLDDLLSRANYPIREIEALSESETEVELAAKLVPTTANPDELDHVVAELDNSPLVRSATWTVGTAV